MVELSDVGVLFILNLVNWWDDFVGYRSFNARKKHWDCRQCFPGDICSTFALQFSLNVLLHFVSF